MRSRVYEPAFAGNLASAPQREDPIWAFECELRRRIAEVWTAHLRFLRSGRAAG